MVFWEPVNAPAGFTQVYSILRAPTGNSADAIYRLQTSPSAPAKVFFRGIDLTEQQIIVDASPLGEMFLATYDMSTIIHEPKPGGMAKIVIPPNLRRIFAATWF